MGLSIFIGVFIFNNSVEGAVVIQATSSMADEYIYGVTGTKTLSHTTVAGDNLLLVGLGQYAGTISVPTYDGISMTLLIGNSCWSQRCFKWYYLLNPPIGNHNVSISITAETYSHLGAISMSGVDTNNPFGGLTPYTATSTIGVGNTLTTYPNVLSSGVVVFEGGITSGSGSRGFSAISPANQNWYAVSPNSNAKASIYQLFSTATSTVGLSATVQQSNDTTYSVIGVQPVQYVAPVVSVTFPEPSTSTVSFSNYLIDYNLNSASFVQPVVRVVWWKEGETNCDPNQFSPAMMGNTLGGVDGCNYAYQQLDYSSGSSIPVPSYLTGWAEGYYIYEVQLFAQVQDLIYEEYYQSPIANSRGYFEITSTPFFPYDPTDPVPATTTVILGHSVFTICDENLGVFQFGLCKVFMLLFQPDQRTLTYFQDTQRWFVRDVPPFSYFGLYKSAISSMGVSTTPSLVATSSISIGGVAKTYTIFDLSKTTDLAGSGTMTLIRNIMVWSLYVLFLIYVIYRIFFLIF